jgi:probable F420-dependent oxidoreductase
MSELRLDGVGVWSFALRFGDRDERAEAASELEELGYSALWIPDVGGDVFGDVRLLLGASTTITVATGVLNLWMHSAQEVASGVAALDAEFPGRFLLGIGVSHAERIDRTEPGRYRQPFTKMRSYLDELDATDPPVTAKHRVLAALGPKMLELARERARGAHPYIANPDHTHVAREILGEGPLLLPEQPVVLETDPSRARERARGHVSHYLGLPNYANNLRRLGFTDDDLADGGSNRLIDGIVAWGDEAAIAERVQQHFAAGANHVCIQAASAGITVFPREEWRALAPAITGLRS